MFADPIDHAVLQAREQIGLQVERHLPDLVQTEHPATRLLDFAGASMLVRAGKGALGVSEKLACNQIIPPGESPLRTWTADDSGVLGQCRWETEPSAVSCSFAGRGPLRWNRPVRGMFGSGKPAMTASNRDQRWDPPA